MAEKPKDLKLFEDAVAGARPLAKRDRVPPARAQPLDAPRASRPVAAAGPAAPQFDPGALRRLKRGEFPVEARLDLHGLGASEARAALIRFVERCQGQGRRSLLVIHGRGEHSEGGEGVLRAAFDRWLGEAPLRDQVLAACEARPRDGGGGAHYLLLRKPATLRR